ncbi:MULTISPECIES: tRNA(Met) cytidine acetyltransferase TmcA [unclassified Pantoea]|uniref:tRNA(Met) cytidine acetyltransferase TmcA n=1 Tax=unclassified Pantoea TaxID=2630326 RepID=UPI001CD1C766|nr:MULTISPECIES: GNAT family N-acetyltransferase [unclassified Pantoea]MCA1175908.1 GNAT family N-acetyltransferase [Pantoea sp. alder69]MCA1250740.1 GNAT family N-acetyltransferase [Pantoea sp. alder70]MCA1265046.1 GNAT family N-acetyltransferase [Pantoea sp. alder81]
MSLIDITAAMQRAGIRRLCVVSGEADWALQQAVEWRAVLPGDWLTLSDNDDFPQRVAPAALRTLLGREFQHAIFDARSGFHAEAFAALAGTLRAGSWLLLLTPPWHDWATQPDDDSLRWADVAEPIATPHFIHHLQQLMEQDQQVMLLDQHQHQHQQPVRAPELLHQHKPVRASELLHRHKPVRAPELLHRHKPVRASELLHQHQPERTPALLDLPDWHCQAPQQQAQILQQLLTMPSGVAVITAARGRGKSALAGMLAQHNQHCLVTAPAKVSTEVLAAFAGEHFHFMAPDAILAMDAEPSVQWLIVDEAAAIPAPLLQQLVQRFPRVLMTTTVQGYEGTGRGFMLRFCATLPQVKHFQLDEPLRWSANDPLEKWLSQALLFEDAIESEPGGEITIFPATPEQGVLEAGYRLLASAHYRTSPLDLRRMLDAPGMRFWLAGTPENIVGALWLVEEGGLEEPLAEAVWAGLRRPRGNLVAQSLAAHAGFTQAATLRSQRISRIAVLAAQRQRGIGSALVAAAQQQADGCDFLSVSFGYTETLWQFWQRCGFTLVRIGSQREASSGCYAAMAIRALTPAGERLQQQAAQRFSRDAVWLRDIIDLPFETTEHPQTLNDDDWPLLAGFAWAQRPYEASYAVLQRLVRASSQPLLEAILVQKQALTEVAQQAGISGRKALVLRLRQEAAAALMQCDASRAKQWQQQLASLQ